MPRLSKLFFIAALGLAGCAHDPAVQPALPKADAQFSAQGKAADSHWLEQFKDPELLQLIVQARQANPDLDISRAHEREALATLTATSGDRQPTLDLQASFLPSQISTDTGRWFAGMPRQTNVTSVGLAASWELDFWGKKAANVSGAEADYRGAVYSSVQADLALCAEVARLWFSVCEAREEVACLELEFKARYREMELMEKNVQAGLLPTDPLSTAQLATAQAKVDEGSGRRRLLSAENALRAIVGAQPGATLPIRKNFAPVADLPNFGPGVASDLLKQRPDLLAAAAKFDASVAREGAALADFYPSVMLTGQAGWQSDPISRLGQSSAGFWSLGPSIDLPLFDGDRRETNLEINRARIQGAAAEWRKAVIGACREVEDALGDLRELAFQEELTRRVVQATQDRLTNAEARFKAGVANEAEVVAAQRDSLLAKRTLAGVVWERREVAVRLATATGGGSMELGSQKTSSPEK
jgi:NodT family efflux transporter outer membrane factor (OMF) lipoprotein